MMMKLFLASRINTPESLNKLNIFLGSDLSTKSVVYIPSAANAEDGWGSWRKSPTLNMVQQLCKNLEVVQLEDCRVRDIMPDFEGKDIIWVGGGYSGYLAYWMRLSQFDKKLPELLNKGVVYLGSSAGAMVCSKHQYSAEMGKDPEYGAAFISGLGYLDFEMRPHYTNDEFDQCKKWWKKNGKGDLYLLKDGEVITVVDGEINFSGEKRVIHADNS